MFLTDRVFLFKSEQDPLAGAVTETLLRLQFRLRNRCEKNCNSNYNSSCPPHPPLTNSNMTGMGVDVGNAAKQICLC